MPTLEGKKRINNLDEMGKVLERHKLPTLTQKQTKI